ncbi:MAG TPA: acyl CoA:acetate/3-ketoacid CoA transferase, partial [Smithellaceae bacterium]|nr:acyl CoA:acetate/3-ketoacid CoA transferase [Smithellaceae bacterium]
SKFGPKFAGCGGFIDITQNAKKVFFLGTFTAGDLQISTKDGELVIVKEGPIKKFVKKVEHITFSGDYALEVNQPVLYITERAVFKLTPEGLELIEIAPGMDLQKHILDQMEFKPLIKGTPKLMDKRFFMDAKVGFKSFLP